MAELDFTNIAAASINTPPSGVTATYVESTSPAKRLSTKDDTGTVINYLGAATSDTLTNKLLSDSTTYFVNVSDATKKLVFSLGGMSSNTQLTINGSQTANHQLTIPNLTQDEQMVVTVEAQRLNSKDLDSNTTISNTSSTSQAIAFAFGGMTANKVLTLAPTSSTSQTLTIPNITGADTLAVTTLQQAFTNKSIQFLPGTTTVPPIQLNSGTNTTSALAGEIEYDGVCIYNTVDTTNGRRIDDSWNYFRLTSNGSPISTIADVFGTNDGIPLVTSGVYEIEWHVWLTQSSTGGTYTWTVVNTQAPVNMVGEYIGSPATGIATVGAPQTAAFITSTSTSQIFPVTGSQTLSTSAYFVLKIVEEANASTGGNVRLRLTASGGTATPLRDSYFKVRRLAAGNVGTFVA